MKFFTPELYGFCTTAWHSCPEEEGWRQAWAAACERFGRDVAQIGTQVHTSHKDPLDVYTALGLEAVRTAHAAYEEHLRAIADRLPSHVAAVAGCTRCG